MLWTLEGSGMWAFGPLTMMLVMAAVIVVPFWFIFAKAGFSKWLALLILVPLVNVILLYYLALSKWPSLGNGNA